MAAQSSAVLSRIFSHPPVIVFRGDDEAAGYDTHGDVVPLEIPFPLSE